MVNNHPDTRPGRSMSIRAELRGVFDHEAQFAYPDLGLPAMALPLPAFAADYEPPIVVDQPVEEVPVEVGSGWYLRGDIGYNFGVDATGQSRLQHTSIRRPAPMVRGRFDSASLGNGVTWSVGFGYNFTDMFRADVTVEASGPTSMAPRRVRRPAAPFRPCWERAAARKTSPLRRRSASWSMATSISAPMSASPHMWAAASATRMSIGGRSPIPSSAPAPACPVALRCQLRARRRPKLALHLCRDGRPCLRRLDEFEGRPRLSLSAHRRRADVCL